MEIQTHNFENSKNALKAFSNNIPSSPKLPKVDTHVLFGFFKHDVSGSELNDLTSKMQECLVATNNQIIRVIEEFGQIYKTFESLDKDYIQGIITAIKSAEIASNQAMEAATKAFDAANKSEKNNNDIKFLIENQSVFISKLMDFKKRIENIPNIENISTMWEDINFFKKNNRVIGYKINEIEARISDADTRFLDKQAITKERFIAQDHKISNQNEKLVSLINKNINDLSKDLINFDIKQLQRIKDITSQIEMFQNEIKKNKTVIEERFVKQNMELHQKIKISNVVAGTFGAITLIHAVLAVLGIV